MKVVPVPFSTEGKNMLIHTKELLEFESSIIAIDPKFEKLDNFSNDGNLFSLNQNLVSAKLFNFFNFCMTHGESVD